MNYKYSFLKFGLLVSFLIMTLNLKAQQCTFVQNKVSDFKKCVKSLRADYEKLVISESPRDKKSGLTKREMHKELGDYYNELVKYYRNKKNFDEVDLIKEMKKSLPNAKS